MERNLQWELQINLNLQLNIALQWWREEREILWGGGESGQLLTHKTYVESS